MEINLHCVMYIVTLVLLFCDRMHAFYWNEGIGKRGGMRPYPFPCNGYDNLPRCLHGGKGPRKTWTKAGRFCVCLCPNKWIGAECGYAADLTIGKRNSEISSTGQQMSDLMEEKPIRKPVAKLRQFPHRMPQNDLQPVEDLRSDLLKLKYEMAQLNNRRNDPFYIYNNYVNNYDSLYDESR